jgi:hypothetical protein
VDIEAIDRRSGVLGDARRSDDLGSITTHSVAALIRAIANVSRAEKLKGPFSVNKEMMRLLDLGCRTLLEKGKFALVWIFFRPNGES